MFNVKKGSSEKRYSPFFQFIQQFTGDVLGSKLEEERHSNKQGIPVEFKIRRSWRRLTETGDKLAKMGTEFMARGKRTGFEIDTGKQYYY